MSTGEATILLQESDPDTRDILRDLLEEQGYAVDETNSLQGATALAGEQLFCLVLADISTLSASERDGALEKLKVTANPTPVGLMTTAPVDVFPQMPKGFAFLLRKPFGADQLIAAVADACSGHIAATDGEDIAVIESYFQCLTRKDFQAMGALCTEDVVYVLPGDNPVSRTVHGREAFVAFSLETFKSYPEARFEAVEIYRTPQNRVARYQGFWKMDGGTEASLPGAVVFQMRGNRISQVGIRLNATRLAALTR